MMHYKNDFKIDDEEPLQELLNNLYKYKDDIATKVSHRNRLNLFSVIMKNLIEQNVIESFDKAIDIGCNAGVYSKIISDLGFMYVLGIDIDNNKIKEADNIFAFRDNKKVLEYKMGNAENIDTNNKYNFVLCTEVIEHTADPRKVINNIKEILSPNGIAIITLPNRISLPFLAAFCYHRIKDKKINKDLHDHLSYPFYKSLKLFNDESLKIIKTTGSNLFFNRFILKALYRRSIFPSINKFNYILSRLFPLKYFTQFFFIVIKKNQE